MQLTGKQADILFELFRKKHFDGGLSPDEFQFVRELATAFKIKSLFVRWLTDAGITFIPEESKDVGEDTGTPGFAHGGD